MKVGRTFGVEFWTTRRESGIELTVRYQQIEDGWWMTTCVEIPEAKTQGETIEEARENIADAVRLVIEAKRELAEREVRQQQEGGKAGPLETLTV